jgi:hypothetical protein
MRVRHLSLVAVGTLVVGSMFVRPLRGQIVGDRLTGNPTASSQPSSRARRPLP